MIFAGFVDRFVDGDDSFVDGDDSFETEVIS
jgi:hypothetical protein